MHTLMANGFGTLLTMAICFVLVMLVGALSCVAGSIPFNRGELPEFNARTLFRYISKSGFFGFMGIVIGVTATLLIAAVAIPYLASLHW